MTLKVMASGKVVNVERLRVKVVNAGMSAIVAYGTGGNIIDLASSPTMALIFDKTRSGNVDLTVDALDANSKVVATGMSTGGGDIWVQGANFYDGFTVTVNGTFVTPTPVVPQFAFCVTAPALPGVRGKVDLVVTNVDAQSAKAPGAIEYYAGTLLFNNPKNSPVGPSQLALGVADFNGDFKPDIVVGGPNGSILVLPGNGDGTFKQAVQTSMSSTVAAIALGDVNKDGKMDIAYTDGSTGIGVMKGSGDGTFTQGFASNSIHGTGPHSVVLGDLNADQKLDIAVAESSFIWVFLGNGDGTFMPLKTYAGDASANYTSLFIAEVDNGKLGNHRPDILAMDDALGRVACWFGLDAGGFSLPPTTVQIDTGPTRMVATGRYPLEPYTDVYVTNNAKNTVTFLLDKWRVGSSGLSATTLPAGVGPYAIVAADFDASHAFKLALSNPGSGVIGLYAIDGTKITDMTINQRLIELAVGDFNGDGLTDVVGIDQAAGVVSVLLNSSQ